MSEGITLNLDFATASEIGLFEFLRSKGFDRALAERAAPSAPVIQIDQMAYVPCVVTGIDSEDGQDWISLVTPDGRDIEVKREKLLAAAQPGEPAPSDSERASTDALYAAYANHCAIEGKVAKTWHTWKRERSSGPAVQVSGTTSPAKDGDAT